MSKPGAFIISLDFELHWGVFDHTDLNDRSRAYFDRTRRLIPPTLDLFERHRIGVSWATVGMLFARSKAELTAALPVRRPSYVNPSLDPYRLIPELGEDERTDPYHYAPSLIAQVAATPLQVIGSHTFGHYYCLEAGQQLDQFTADLGAAQALARRSGYAAASSIVFPRNQYRADYFTALTQHDFTTYRSNPKTWFWRSRSGNDTTMVQRMVRLTDNYLPISESTFAVGGENPGSLNRPFAVPASRFFRPYIAKIDGYGGQRLKIRRILGEMTSAARAGTNYHLWWHPHNLATHPEKNMAALVEIISHYDRLRRKYGWESHSMESYVNQLSS